MQSKNISLVDETLVSLVRTVNSETDTQNQQLAQIEGTERERTAALQRIVEAFEAFLKTHEANAPEYKAWRQTLREGQRFIEGLEETENE